jgi:cytochrome c
MNMATQRIKQLQILVAACAAIFFANHAMALDADAAEHLAKSSMCLTCHDVNIKKIGPAYHEVAQKYKGQTDALAKIEKHITSAPMIKMPSGQQAKHLVIKTSDPAQVKNVAEWILSR